MPNGNVVTIRTTTGIVQDCLLTEARPQPKKAHSIEAAEKDPAALETWGERMKAAHQVSVEENVVERQ
ncbi:hypothetical protein HBH89_067990 [Parastagonospora nodorum]|nr:hypothetical protein HBH52_058620 [Parastagonospora nodorum]KAH3985801.1 hypothetical protein HBH51_017520 [Parastagonospora nodorum]KAH4142469.1 hypothetical protein HBH45_050050 [Parastagonospora nodorum]KAH4154532.1 hypothetical protein HBH44_145320 [Parastagonospora nodorum]KAH4507641.1 hypothetical protein HBH89_067990 [Parastagonospora nodorum]